MINLQKELESSLSQLVFDDDDSSTKPQQIPQVRCSSTATLLLVFFQPTHNQTIPSLKSFDALTFVIARFLLLFFLLNYINQIILCLREKSSLLPYIRQMKTIIGNPQSKHNSNLLAVDYLQFPQIWNYSVNLLTIA